MVVEVLLQTPAAAPIARRLRRDGSLHAPGLIDIEVAQVLRRFTLSGQISVRRGGEAILDLADFPLRRYPHTPLLERAWELRDNFTAYDAAYVALAEILDVPLMTRDARLSRTPGHRATVELV